MLDYVRETADEFDVTDRIRFGHRVLRAAWSSDDAVWRTTVVPPGGDERTLTSSFLYVCSGYYDYDEPYDAHLSGLADFAGDVLHPQHWPDGYDVGGRRVVVVGSGATAVSMVPELTRTARSVVMLQRTPSFVLSLPRVDPTSDALRALLPPQAAHRANRTKNALVAFGIYQACRRAPGLARRALTGLAGRALPPGADAGTLFDPPYEPWDQRLCMVPDNDLFEAVGAGAEIVTDTIDTFTRTGIRLTSGRVLEADAIVTATGLAVKPAGGIAVEVDGAPVDIGETWFFRGVLVSGLPNFGLCVGYTNSTWTLRAELSTRFVCRLLKHLDRHGLTVAVPDAPPEGEPPLPLLDLTSGYLARSAHLLPRRAASAPWNLTQNYLRDSFDAVAVPVGRGLTFARTPVRPRGAGQRETVGA
ncbi:flavin-containing monooxygenase [Frondihabitans australicus]|uniref:flavin-containing monooxygenase n=1 Tax=Frondihabitans australicus TaxID=386892 RepID=UPI0024821E79|nr:NAD(P)/FAD-dependent oxidoreductase [Frondihabitans australicus]